MLDAAMQCKILRVERLVDAIVEAAIQNRPDRLYALLKSLASVSPTVEILRSTGVGFLRADNAL